MSEPTKEKPVIQPGTNFPSGLTGKNLWSPPFPHPLSVPDVQPPLANATAPASPCTFSFSDELLSEVQSAMSLAFSHAAQMASVDVRSDKQSTKPFQEPVISLYYPHDGCHEMIDSMVKSLALAHSADVVVLDSLELAMGEFGAFGEETAQAMDALYGDGTSAMAANTDASSEDDHVSDDEHVSDSENHDEKVDSIQKVFDDIVDIQQEDFSLRTDSNNEQVKSRIVYMRDFGSIAASAKPLFSYLLQALRNRRTAKFYNGLPEGERRLQPTVLILGFAETPDIGHEDDDGDSWLWGGYREHEAKMKRISRGFTEGGAALEQILPSLDDKLFTLKSGTLPLQLSSFLTSFFLRSLVNPGQLRLAPKYNFTLTSDTTDLTYAAAFLSIFPIEGHSDGFRKVEQYTACRRKLDVRNAWLTVCLGHRGASICENPLDSIHVALHTSAVGEEQIADPPAVHEVLTSLDALCEFSDVLPIVLCRIATMALGFSSSLTAGLETDMPISQAAISKAYQLFIRNSKIRSDWWQKAIMNQEEAEKEADTKSEKAEEESADSKNEGTSLDPIVKKVRESDDLNTYERNLLSCIVDGEKLVTTFEDICIPENVIDSLRTIVSLPLLQPSAFKIGILGREAIGGVLLYGPPGTGKTLVCRALARECGARILQLEPSDVLHYYLGESEKSAKSIFTLAYRLAPCIIVIDEMDSLFGARKGKDDHRWDRNILNEFLQSMDGLQSAKKNKDAGIVIIGATNRPYDMDDAVLRRLPSRMMLDLPGEKEREQILHLHLQDEKLDEDVDLSNIASKTNHYSGSDLKNLCVSAAMESVKESVGNFSWKPRTPDHPGTPVVGDETESKIQARTIKLAHFMHAINEVSPSSSTGSHSELYRWHGQFGRKKHLNESKHGGPQVDGRLGKSSSGLGGIGGYESRAGGFGGGGGTDIYKGGASGYGYGRGAVAYNRGASAFSGSTNGYGGGGYGGIAGGFGGGTANGQRTSEGMDDVTVKGNDAGRA